MEECQTTVSVNPSGLRLLRQKRPKVESSRQQQKTTFNVCSFLKKQFLGKGVFTLYSQEKKYHEREIFDYNLSVLGICWVCGCEAVLHICHPLRSKGHNPDLTS